MDLLNRVANKNWLYALGLLFVLLNGLCIAFEFYYFAILPLVMLVVWAAFMRLDLLLLFIVFSTPLSLNLEQLAIGGVGFYLPTEPLLFGVLVLFVFKLLYGTSIDQRIFRHPVSFAIYIYLGWMFLTCISSTMPVVSFKFLLSRLWFIASFYFLAIHIFKNPNHIRRYFLLYLIPFTGVIIYTIVHHSQFGFDQEAGHWVMSPFYKDHTSYGAVLAMVIPVTIGLLMLRRIPNLLRVFLIFALVFLLVGIVLSYTRAAWVSLVVAAVTFLFLQLRVKLHTLLIAVVALGAFVYIFQNQLLMTLERNETESSDKLAEHVESISNISSDASNLERLNRWDAAISMFLEKPLLGWGPGTYQFKYAPFQRSENRTIISTNQADGGNAHSEYLGPLAESGFIGTLTVILLFYMVTRLGFKLSFNLKDRKWRIIAVSTFLGWLTYIIHGVLNNYLDTDKASILFWGFIAVLVAIDLYHNDADHADPATKKLENPAT